MWRLHPNIIYYSILVRKNTEFSNNKNFDNDIICVEFEEIKT